MENRPLLHIIKAGGSVFQSEEVEVQFLKDFTALEGKKILVHGGGNQASLWLSKLGINPIKVEGRRITDRPTLEVITKVYAGLNKEIVAKLQAMGCKCLGISGADGGTIQAHKREVKEVDYGYAGDIDLINLSAIIPLLQIKYNLVFCPLTYNPKGSLLNTNADTIASKLAISLSKMFQVELQFIGNTPGVLTDIENPESKISQLAFEEYEIMKEEGNISEGMIPKLDNAFDALNSGIHSIQLDNRINIQDIHCGGTQLKL